MNLVLLRQLIVNASSKNQVYKHLIKIVFLMQFSMTMHELSLVQIRLWTVYVWFIIELECEQMHVQAAGSNMHRNVCMCMLSRIVAIWPNWVLPVDLWLLMGHEIHSWFLGNCTKHFLLQPKPQWSDVRWSRSPGGGTATKHITGGAEVCWEVLRTPGKVN